MYASSNAFNVFAISFLITAFCALSGLTPSSSPPLAADVDAILTTRDGKGMNRGAMNVGLAGDGCMNALRNIDVVVDEASVTKLRIYRNAQL